MVPLVLAACGGGSSPKNGNQLSSAVEKTLAQGSEKVTLDGKVDVSGQTLTLTGGGAFGSKGGTLHLNVDVPLIGRTSIDEIVVGKRAWLRSALLGKRWVPVGSSPKALGFDARALTGVTPASALVLGGGHLLEPTRPGYVLVRGEQIAEVGAGAPPPGLLAEVGIAAAQLALQQLGESPRPTRARHHNGPVPAG